MLQKHQASYQQSIYKGFLDKGIAHHFCDPKWVNSALIGRKTYNTTQVQDENVLMYNHADWMSNKFEEGYSINLYDLYVANFNSSLPFVYELMSKNKLNRYTAVVSEDLLAQNAVDNAKTFQLEAMLPDFIGEKHIEDIAYENIQERVAYNVTADEANGLMPINVCMMMASAFGTVPNPERILKNIYDSLNSGDYLILLQGLEADPDTWIKDYKKLSDRSFMSRFIAEKINPDYGEFEIVWDDSKQFPSIVFKIDVNPELSPEFMGVDLSHLQTFEVFRTFRPSHDQMVSLIEQSGFYMDTIFPARTKTTSIFIARK